MKEETAKAAVLLPKETWVQMVSAMHIRLVRALTAGGGGSIPAEMPWEVTKPKNSWDA